MPIFPGWQIKPPLGTPVNLAHPLAQGIIFDLPITEQGGSPVELISGIPGTLTGAAPTWLGSPYGQSFFSDFSTPVGFSYQALSPSYITLLGVINSTYTNTMIFNRDYSGVIPWGLSGEVGDNGGMWLYNGAFISTNPSTNPMTSDGSWHVLAGTSDGTNLKFYFDGFLNAQTAFSGVLPTNGTPIYVGSGGYTGTSFGNSAMALARIWNRALSPSEIALISANPWQIYAEPQYYWLLKAAAVLDPMFTSMTSISVP